MLLDYKLSPTWNRKTAEVDLRAADEMRLSSDCFLGDAVSGRWRSGSRCWCWLIALAATVFAPDDGLDYFNGLE